MFILMEQLLKASKIINAKMEKIIKISKYYQFFLKVCDLTTVGTEKLISLSNFLNND